MRDWGVDEATVEILRGRMEGVGPTTATELAGDAGLSIAEVDKALLALEAEGFVLRGQYTPHAAAASAQIF